MLLIIIKDLLHTWLARGREWLGVLSCKTILHLWSVSGISFVGFHPSSKLSSSLKTGVMPLGTSFSYSETILLSLETSVSPEKSNVLSLETSFLALEILDCSQHLYLCRQKKNQAK